MPRNDRQVTRRSFLERVGTGDGTPDIIVCNKKGTFIHLSQPGK